MSWVLYYTYNEYISISPSYVLRYVLRMLQKHISLRSIYVLCYVLHMLQIMYKPTAKVRSVLRMLTNNL